MTTENTNKDINSSTGEGGSSSDIIGAGTVLVGNYEIQDISGKGGMAIVYKGVQKSLNRPVAIKVLHQRYVREQAFVERFDKEADILANLNHANVVAIIDKGNDNGRYFFVMEWLEGQTLDQLIIDKKITPGMWSSIIENCRDGMTYVHNRGVVHRDLKPSNIMISDDNLAKIGDFGIIHLIAGDKSASNKISKKKRSLGTENYMAPEQQSDDESVDVRADVYSLAVTFFKMFTRRMPKEGGHTPSQHNSDVPTAVDAVIDKALSVNREERHQTVEEFCNDLLKALKKQGTNISSILGSTPSPRISKSLYTGNDFTPMPKKDGATPAGGSMLSPKPVKGDSKPAAPEKKKSALPVILIGIVVVIAIIAIIAFGFLKFMGIA